MGHNLPRRHSPPKADQLYREGRSAMDARNYALAERKFAEAIALEPANTDFRLDLAVSLEKQGKLDDALRECDRLLELFPDGRAWNYKAILLNRMRLFEEAVMCADNALRLDDEDVDAWDTMGYALERLGKIDEAKQCYDVLILLFPQEGYQRKGFLFLSLCDFENAVICFDKALEMDGRNEMAWNGKGIACQSLGLYEDAINCYHNAIVVVPNDCDLWANKGEAYLLQGNFQEAERCFQKATSLDPKFSGSLLGYLYLFQSRFQEALKWFDKEPRNEFSSHGKVLCKYLMSNPRPPTCPNPTERKILKQFGKLEQTDLYYFRGRVMLIFGELKQAKKAFEKCLELSPKYKAAAIEIDKINCGTHP